MTATATASNTTKNNGKNAAPLPEAETAAAFPKAGGGEFQKVDLDRPSFKAELFLAKEPGSLIEIYKGPICQGYVTGLVAMPEAFDEETGELRPWNVYVVELTAPTTAVDRGEKRDMKKGEIVIVAETALLKQAIPAVVANHPTQMLHVQICPISREPMKDDGKKRLWKTDVHVAAPVARKSVLSGNSVIASMLASAKTAQLPG